MYIVGLTPPFAVMPSGPDQTKDVVNTVASSLDGVGRSAAWNSRGDGFPTSNEYDLQSVFLHELGHGLGFLSNDAYDPFFDLGSLDQPTPFDAYLQTADGRRLAVTNQVHQLHIWMKQHLLTLESIH